MQLQQQQQDEELQQLLHMALQVSCCGHTPFKSIENFKSQVDCSRCLLLTASVTGKSQIAAHGGARDL
jgi:hypothetical protein